jgi:hypothetical protein
MIFGTRSLVELKTCIPGPCINPPRRRIKTSILHHVPYVVTAAWVRAMGMYVAEVSISSLSCRTRMQISPVEEQVPLPTHALAEFMKL